MRDLFATASKDLRRAKLQEYEAYLSERDGEMNLQERTLAKRELGMQRFETPPPVPRNLDAEEFQRQYVKFDRKRALSAEMLMLLSLVKVNAAEAWGVTRSFQKAMDLALRAGDKTELLILCEETYHTRILLSAANLYGIEVNDPYVPPSGLRILIGGIVSAPKSIARPLTLAGEIIGTLAFTKLLSLVPSVLKDAPEVRDAIEERLIEICTDEHGHVSYNRLLSNAIELAETRLLLPLTARALSSALPELCMLGAFPRNVLQDLALLTDPKKLPEAVRRNAFMA
jgi:hypothetical protein